MASVAPDISVAVDQPNLGQTITPVITSAGAPVTADSLAIDTAPTHGTAVVVGLGIVYTPTAGYLGADSFTYHAVIATVSSSIGTVTLNDVTGYNPDFEDGFPTTTVLAMERRIQVRLGRAAMSVMPAGSSELIRDFMESAQKLLYRKYVCFRTKRWFTWDMSAGQRFFSFGANRDAFNQRLDPRLIEWAGVSLGDAVWRELICGINPVLYSPQQQSLSQYYQVRQGIEVWPAMSNSSWQLRIYGTFDLMPFTADTDISTIDAEAIFMLALANAKAHYGQPDAGNYMSELQEYIGELTAGNQPTRRFFPGARTLPNAVRPKMVP